MTLDWDRKMCSKYNQRKYMWLHEILSELNKIVSVLCVIELWKLRKIIVFTPYQFSVCNALYVVSWVSVACYTTCAKFSFLWEPDCAQASWPVLSSWTSSMILSTMSSTLLPYVLERSVRYQIEFVFLKDFKNFV